MRYFYGEDTYAAREAIGALVTKKEASIRWLDRTDLEEKSLLDWVDEGESSLFGRELAVVRDPSRFPKPLQEAVVEVAVEDKDMVVWDRVLPDKRSKLFRSLKVRGREFRTLSEPELIQWVQLQAGFISGTEGSEAIEPAAARELVQRVGYDKWRLRTVLEVLLLTGSVTTWRVRELAEEQRKAEIFAMLDALAAGNMRVATEMVDTMLADGESEFYILSMLAYQCKTLLAIASGDTQGLHPYVVQKNLVVAHKFSPAQLLGALTKVAATDFVIKQGKVDARTGLVMLITSLFT